MAAEARREVRRALNRARRTLERASRDLQGFGGSLSRHFPEMATDGAQAEAENHLAAVTDYIEGRAADIDSLFLRGLLGGSGDEDGQ